MKFTTLFPLVFFFLSPVCFSQRIAALTIELSDTEHKSDIPVNVDLDEITFIPDSMLSLFEARDSDFVPVPFQIEPGERRRLHWIIEAEATDENTRCYELIRKKSFHPAVVKADLENGCLTIHQEDKNLLSYWFRTVYPPPGVDTIYKRSGFIHPLRTPSGHELTRIQPPDHYHHYGIWNPWTQVLFEKDTIDFWNINSRQGTVRFANFVSVVEGPVFSEFEALHEHVVFKKTGKEKVALNELHKVRVYRVQRDCDCYFIDFYFRMSCAGESPFRILEYLYAGLGWRTTGEWDRNNSMVLTSEGRTRKDSDGSKARWCIVQGNLGNDYGGALMMSYPANYNFPEPLRVWPEDQNERGDLFVNFCPVKDMDWLLKPHNNYFLRYRFLVYNGRIEEYQAENSWKNFSSPPLIRVIKY